MERLLALTNIANVFHLNVLFVFWDVWDQLYSKF